MPSRIPLSKVMANFATTAQYYPHPFPYPRVVCCSKLYERRYILVGLLCGRVTTYLNSSVNNDILSFAFFYPTTKSKRSIVKRESKYRKGKTPVQYWAQRERVIDSGDFPRSTPWYNDVIICSASLSRDRIVRSL